MIWSEDIESVLEEIRINAVQLSNNHKENYFFYKSLHKYFRIPTIILSSVASVFVSGGVTKNYISQQHTNALVCLIALTISVVNSIELFLKLQETLETELNCSKEFYNLSIDIRKTLLLNTENRQQTGQIYLETKYNEYVKLQEQSNLINNKFNDGLNKLPKKKSFIKQLIKKTNSSSSSASSASSASSTNSPIVDDDDTFIEERL